MHKISVIISLMLISVSSGLTFGQVKSPAFIWGINGHPLTQVAYSNNIDEQIKQLTDLKMTSYRFDVLLDSDGNAKKEALLITLLTKLKAANISSLPVLMQSGFKGLDNTATYNVAYKQGVNFAAKYGKFLSVVEVNNEADNKMILPGNPTGMKEGDYDVQKAQKIIASIKGFINGLKSVNKTVKVSLSVSYVHYYYLELLKNNAVNYDIIGCHWYSNMGSITNTKLNGDNVVKKITERFKKPIWVTEFNYSKGTLKTSHAKQGEYFGNAIPDITASGVKALFIYELYDQPALSVRNINEAFYGLLYKDNYGNFGKKDAYNSIQQLILEEAHKN